jgi:aspartyl/asparaginyl-tRNA synthetase
MPILVNSCGYFPAKRHPLRQNAYSDMGRGSFAMPVQTNALQSLHELPKPLEQLSVDELRRKREISEVSTRTLRCLTEQFTMFGFEWELPVIFSKSTDPLWPDPGASIEKRIEVDVYDENVRTTLSMIVHKLVACSLLHPKLFILSPNVRIEKRERKSTGWHAYEFTQLDFEARSASSRDIMQLCEIILRAVVEDLNANCGQTLNSLRGGKLEVQTTPFEVYDREELVAKYLENSTIIKTLRPRSGTIMTCTCRDMVRCFLGPSENGSTRRSSQRCNGTESQKRTMRCFSGWHRSGG